MKQPNMQGEKIAALTFFADFHGDVTDDIKNPRCLGSMASSRLQIVPSLVALSKIGYEHVAYSFHHSRKEEFEKLDGSRACFVGKLSADTPERMKNMAVANWEAINYLKDQNTKIVLTYCDNHLHNTKANIIRLLYRELFKISDYIVYPSAVLKSLSNEFLSPRTKTFIIKDPWQIREQSPYQPKQYDQPWKIIWFGSNKNLKYLTNLLPQLINSSLLTDTYELTVLGGEYAIKEVSMLISEILKEKNIFRKWTFRLVTWDMLDQPNQLEAELKRAQISIIPSDQNDPSKKGASHNRVVDSIRSGCLAIASPLKSYQELSKVVILGDNFERLLYNSTKEYERLTLKHDFYRKEFLSDFSPQANIKNWTNFWKYVL